MCSNFPEKDYMNENDPTFIMLLAQYALTSEDVRNYCRNKLKILMDSDNNNGTEYMKTLLIYIETGKSLSSSAEKLYVHRNTVLQRIKKISGLLQINLHEFDVLNEYYLMLKIMEYEKRRT